MLLDWFLKFHWFPPPPARWSAWTPRALNSRGNGDVEEQTWIQSLFAHTGVELLRQDQNANREEWKGGRMGMQGSAKLTAVATKEANES